MFLAYTTFATDTPDAQNHSGQFECYHLVEPPTLNFTWKHFIRRGPNSIGVFLLKLELQTRQESSGEIREIRGTVSCHTRVLLPARPSLLLRYCSLLALTGACFQCHHGHVRSLNLCQVHQNIFERWFENRIQEALGRDSNSWALPPHNFAVIWRFQAVLLQPLQLLQLEVVPLKEFKKALSNILCSSSLGFDFRDGHIKSGKHTL